MKVVVWKRVREYLLTAGGLSPLRSPSEVVSPKVSLLKTREITKYLD